jgi:predicted metal-dependent hydrolase
MLEVIIIMSIVYLVQLWGIRGKTLDALSERQSNYLRKRLERYNSRARQPRTEEEMLVVLQKEFIQALVMLCVGVVLWIIAVFYVYPMFF